VTSISRHLILLDDLPSLPLKITGEYFSVWKAAHLEGSVRAAGVEERAGEAHLRHTLAHVLE
jgi:hypothetical protein